MDSSLLLIISISQLSPGLTVSRLIAFRPFLLSADQFSAFPTSNCAPNIPVPISLLRLFLCSPLSVFPPTGISLSKPQSLKNLFCWSSWSVRHLGSRVAPSAKKRLCVPEQPSIHSILPPRLPIASPCP